MHWLRRLVFRGAWLDQRVKEGELEVVFDEARRTLRLRPARARQRADRALARALLEARRLQGGASPAVSARVVPVPAPTAGGSPSPPASSTTRVVAMRRSSGSAVHGDDRDRAAIVGVAGAARTRAAPRCRELVEQSITTAASPPRSAARLARSTASSAACACSSAGRSNAAAGDRRPRRPRASR